MMITHFALETGISTTRGEPGIVTWPPPRSRPGRRLGSLPSPQAVTRRKWPRRSTSRGPIIPSGSTC